MDIAVMHVSHNKRERNFFHQVVENGFGDDIYLFVHFLCPVIVVHNDVEIITDSNACIVYPPGARQEYKSYRGAFKNDFLIFKTHDTNFINRYGLPINELFYISNGDEVTWILEKITYLVTSKLADYSAEIEERVMALFETLSKEYIENKPGQKRNFEIRQRFISLREEIKKNPKSWDVDKMAKHVWFTRSRFTVLYNEFFGLPPNTDLVDIRIEFAKNLLETTDQSVAEVSENCGYQSVDHFIRMFKKKTDLTPLKYRKNSIVK